jgi:hypothetical protein
MATTSPAPEDDRKMTASLFRSRVLSHVECGHERREQMKRLMLGFAVVAAVGVAVVPLASATSRSGNLVVTKECSGFVPTNNPPYCTITSSNLGAIPDGSRIFYLDPNRLGTPTGGAVVLDPPGPGEQPGVWHVLPRRQPDALRVLGRNRKVHLVPRQRRGHGHRSRDDR